MQKYTIQTLITLVAVLLLSVGVYLYTSGYRLSRKQNEPTVNIKKTGLISARSIPEGANVYINGVLYTTTDDTISSLDPGEYTLRVLKNGFVPWEKTVNVMAELATDITAVLVSQTPRLEPLTNTGARNPVVSPSLEKLAYFSKDGEESGIWIIPLGNQGLNIFRSAPYVAIEDTAATIFSNGNSIEWSEDEEQLLVQTQDEMFYLVDINSRTIESTASPDLARVSWETDELEKRTKFLDKLSVSEEINSLALDPNSVWAPDEMKFLTVGDNGTELEYKVYNLEKPLPIDEKVENTVLTINKNDPQPNLTWYSDSFHLIVTELEPNENKRGKISLIRIDGTNKTEIYNNSIYFDNVYSTPGGDKLIFLTSFKSSEQTDLYTIGIR